MSTLTAEARELFELNRNESGFPNALFFAKINKINPTIFFKYRDDFQRTPFFMTKKTNFARLCEKLFLIYDFHKELTRWQACFKSETPLDAYGFIELKA
jgi:hypothetical protein